MMTRSQPMEVDGEQPIVEMLSAELRRSAADQDVGAAYPHIVCPGLPADIPHDAELYAHLRAVRAQIPQYPQGVELADDGVSNLPLLGGLLTRLRRGLHQIALFYADRVKAHQVGVNRQLQGSLVRLTAVTQQQQRQIQRLERELQQLRQQNEEAAL